MNYIKNINDHNDEYSDDVDTKSKEGVEKFLSKALKRWTLSAKCESARRIAAVDDIRFLIGEQWPQDIVTERSASSRPCLTHNRLPQFVRQVVNELRQNRPSMTASPVQDGDIETAEIMEGIFRHIEYDSDADVAYDTASGCAVKQSYGVFRLITKFEDPKSFHQVIKIESIPNPFSVYSYPYCIRPDYSDSQWCFIIEDMPKEDFKREYPNADMASLEAWKGEGDLVAQWVTEGTVRVAEYYYIIQRKTTIVLLSSGQVFEEKELVDEDGNSRIPKGIYIKQRRDTFIPEVKWCKISATEVLEETDWPGSTIPVVYVIGDEHNINGEVVYESIIRHAKDPQRMLNLWVSSEAEMISLSPKAPWIGVEGQFEGHEDEWRRSNVDNLPYLEYKAVSLNGIPVPAPQRNIYEPPIQAITNARQQCVDDIKATVGMYDASVGAPGNETSGKAILARDTQSSASNFHFKDNTNRAIRRCGQICMELIPFIYDTPRLMRIVTESGDHKQVQINQKFVENGIEKLFDITTGKYDVIIKAGPSYSTKRQEGAAMTMALVDSYPPIMAVAGDLIAKNLDMPGGTEIGNRLYKSLPPALQNSDTDDVPASAKATMTQQSQMIQTLTAEVTKLSTKLEGRMAEIQSKERMSLEHDRMEIIKALIAEKGDANRTVFVEELKHLSQKLDQNHQMAMANQDATEANDATQDMTQSQQPAQGQ